MKNSVIRMSPEGFAAVVNLLDRPAKPVPEMVELLKRRLPWETQTAAKYLHEVPITAPEPLSEAHDLSQFSVGKPALDKWLRTRALSNQGKGFTAVAVAHAADRVVGCYSLAPSAVVPIASRA